jgi:membrane associated rhomboid family serine protease
MPADLAPPEGPTTCFHHRDRETGRACTRCGRPACPECLRQAAVGSQCWECIRDARPPARERARRWNATAGPIVTKTLIAINVVVFLLTSVAGAATSRGPDLSSRLALFGPAVQNGEWYRLVTSGFVHAGLVHLGFNMLLLYRLGEVLEPALGRVRFIILFAGSLLAGSLGALWVSPHAVTVGASGAVFGLLGAVAVGMRERGASVWQSGIGTLLVVNLLFTFLVPGISIGGHLGGLAGGAVLGWVLLRTRPAGRVRS